MEEEEEEEEELPTCVSRHTLTSYSFGEFQNLLTLLAFPTNTDGSTVSDNDFLHTLTPCSSEPQKSSKTCSRCTPITQALMAAL